MVVSGFRISFRSQSKSKTYLRLWPGIDDSFSFPFHVFFDHLASSDCKSPTGLCCRRCMGCRPFAYRGEGQQRSRRRSRGPGNCSDDLGLSIRPTYRRCCVSSCFASPCLLFAALILPYVFKMTNIVGMTNLAITPFFLFLWYCWYWMFSCVVPSSKK